MQIQKYFILLNIFATLSQHWPRHQDQQIATIIVSATSTARTDVSVAVASAGAEAETEARTTSASAFVDEVLPHNDSVATTAAITKTTNATILHVKDIDSSKNNNNSSSNNSNDLARNNKYYSNKSGSENESEEELTQLIERKLQEEQKTALASASLTVDDDAAAGAARTAAVPTSVHLLSRKRRYLIFPEGSSFQLVYDGIYGIVDYTNYLILGITVALAWELPSKPQGEVIEEIATRLRDPTNDLRRNDTASQITYLNTKKKSNPINGKQTTQQPVKSLRPNYINLMTYTNPAIRKSDYKSYYTNVAGRLPAAFHAPMHQKYYFNPKGSNIYDYNKYVKYHILQQQQRPNDSYYRKQRLPSHAVGGNYKERPNDWRRKDNNYYVQSVKKTNYNNKLSTLKVNPFNKWRPQQRKSGIYSYMPQTQAGSGQYPWWNLASRISNSLRRKPIPSRRIDTVSSGKSQLLQQQQQQQQQQPKEKHPTKQQQAASGFYQHSTGTARKHRIYPVFGKRSIADEPGMAPDLATAAAASTASAYIKASNNNNHAKTKQQESTTHHRRYRRRRRSGIIGTKLSHMERIHVRHHRSTRQTLYGKIEKYLDKLGIKNSHHCLLRALCETGQKSNEVRPGTFVGELMRAVFTMPEPLDDDLLENRVHYKDQRFDLANAFKGACAQEYGLCRESLWKSQFVQ
ncbi:myb-like protein AA [Ceratitis capitata]|uniref:myb-like protein AA n=1 Tax=Ceratitis capitata TaxID=7213 RepID=UPI000329AC46|nr:myb-like protein AA [Ceratitis capitata]